MITAGGSTVWGLPQPDFAHLNSDTVDLWRAWLPDFRGHHNALAQTLSAGELERRERYQFESLRERYVLRHGILRSILAAYLKLSPKEIGIEVSELGKPFVVCTAKEPVQFNMSDSGDLVVIAITRDSAIGVDVEQITDAPPMEILPEFSPNEQFVIQGAARQDQADLFYRIWVRKEGLLKAIGSGLGRIKLSDLEVSLNANHFIWETRFGSRPWFGHDFCGRNGFIASVVADQPVRVFRYFDVNLDNLNACCRNCSS